MIEYKYMKSTVFQLKPIFLIDFLLGTDKKMQLIKECKLLWQNEHVAKMSKSAHHQKIAFLGLEIDINKINFRFGFILSLINFESGLLYY